MLQNYHRQINQRTSEYVKSLDSLVNQEASRVRLDVGEGLSELSVGWSELVRYSHTLENGGVFSLPEPKTPAIINFLEKAAYPELEIIGHIIVGGVLGAIGGGYAVAHYFGGPGVFSTIGSGAMGGIGGAVAGGFVGAFAHQGARFLLWATGNGDRYDRFDRESHKYGGELLAKAEARVASAYDVLAKVESPVTAKILEEKDDLRVYISKEKIREGVKTYEQKRTASKRFVSFI